MKLNLVDKKNKKVGDIDVSDDVFLAEPNEHLVHQLLLLQQTRPVRKASSKTRSEVRGGGAKPWKQKGTGRARAGSIRSPLFRGGGVIFGPQVKINVVKMPKRARLKALCSALTLQKDQLIIVDSFPTFAKPKTKDAKDLISNFDKESKKLLILVDQSSNQDLCKSFANIEKCRVVHWQNLNPFDLFNSDLTITDQASLKKVEEWLSGWKTRKGSTVQASEEAQSATSKPKKAATAAKPKVAKEKATPKAKAEAATSEAKPKKTTTRKPKKEATE